MRCCVTKCKNEATRFVSNNLMDGEIPFCKNCENLFRIHCEAREKMFTDRALSLKKTRFCSSNVNKTKVEK